MTEEAISTIQEDIAKDLSDIAACHQEEVNRLMQEFDKHEIDTVVQFEAYKAETQHQTLGLSALEPATTSWPSTEHTHQTEESDDDDEHEPCLFDILHDDKHEPCLFDIRHDDEHEPCLFDILHDDEHEPCLFDILQDDAEEESEQDVPADQHT